MLGSISLCGGARSNCPHPQNMSRGKNMRSPRPESGEALADAEVWARPKLQMSTGSTRIHAKLFIHPPKICVSLKARPCVLSQHAETSVRRGALRPQVLGERNIVTRCPSSDWTFVLRHVEFRGPAVFSCRRGAHASRIHIEHSDLFHS